jgi:hypothetical protein
MTWISWLAHFQQSAARPLPALPGVLTDVPAAQRPALARCLARFQLGESGGHRIIEQIENEPLEASSPEHRAALQLFVREEKRHARILGSLVAGLGRRLLQRNWGQGTFKLGRNLFGLRTKLLVLDVAEVIGIVCYGLVAETLPAGPTRAALAQIAADEEHHLAFHSELFARQTRGRSWTYLLWWLVGLAACASVVIDHGRDLGALGVSRRTLGRALMARLHDGHRRIGSRRQPMLRRSA